jgi:flagellar hook-associated protein 1 FlgK
MSGLMGSLQIALGALQADQAGLSVTSNNISNINTPGYARQQVDLVENQPIQIGNLLFGDGVSVSQITSLRDGVLEQQIANETQEQSQSEAYLSPMEEAEAMFNDSSGTGLQSVISDFFNSFTQLSTDPSSTSLRQSVLTAAQNLADAFNQSATSLTTIQSNLDEEVTADVGQVNNLTGQIAQLNTEIDQLPDATSGTDMLIDERDYAVQQLSALIGVQTSTSSNGDLNVSTANGIALVAGQQSFNLTTQTNATTGHQDVYGQGEDITSDLAGGALGGIIQARDQGIAGALSQLNTLATAIANQVNTVNQHGLYQAADGTVTQGGLFFNTPTTTNAAANMSVYMTDPSQIACATGSVADFATGDNSNALNLADIQDQTIVDNETPIDYYSNFVSELGNEVSEASAESSSQSSVLTQLQQQLSSVSGVSLDEEAVNLIQFQNAYQAAARVIATISTLTSTAVDLGNTGGS